MIAARSLIILGITSLAAQVVLARELIVNLYGNEFFIGWVLFAWLFWVAVGSYAAGRLLSRVSGTVLLSTCHLVLMPLLLGTIIAVRAGREWVAVAAGQVPDLLPAMALAFLALAPLCVVLGAQFAVTVRWRQETATADQKPGIMGHSYVIETLGSVLGGAFFSVFLVRENAFQSAAVLGTLNALAVCFLAAGTMDRSRGKFRLAAGLALLLNGLVLCGSTALDHYTTAWRYRYEELLDVRNTVYGNIAATRTGDQVNFYQDGMPAGTSVSDDSVVEALVHFPMLSHPAPQRVLLIGTGFNGALREILKYNPARVDYAALDPALVRMARPFLPAPLQRALDDPRVHFWPGDLRAHLNRFTDMFDVVIIDLPAPSTALINRYDTADFFRHLQGRMAPGAVVALRLAFAADTVPLPLENLGASIFKALREVFPSVLVLPEETALFLASDRPLPDDPRVLARRLEERAIPTYYVNGPSLVYRYTTDRVARVRQLLVQNRSAGTNRDLYPRAYFYTLTQWLLVFHPALAAGVAGLMGHKALVALLLGGIVFSWIMFSNLDFRLPYRATPCRLPPGTCVPSFQAAGDSSRSARRKSRLLNTHAGTLRNLLSVSVGIAAGSLMAAEVIVINIYQVMRGNIFESLSWLIASFMAGVALGGWVLRRVLSIGARGLAIVHAGIAVYFGTGLVVLLKASRSGMDVSGPVWILPGIIMGMLMGMVFALASRMLSHDVSKDNAVGRLYAADLWGAGLGAAMTSVFLIPVYGIVTTMLMAAGINVLVAVIIAAKHAPSC